MLLPKGLNLPIGWEGKGRACVPQRPGARGDGVPVQLHDWGFSYCWRSLGWTPRGRGPAPQSAGNPPAALSPASQNLDLPSRFFNSGFWTPTLPWVVQKDRKKPAASLPDSGPPSPSHVSSRKTLPTIIAEPTKEFVFPSSPLQPGLFRPRIGGHIIERWEVGGGAVPGGLKGCWLDGVHPIPSSSADRWDWGGMGVVLLGPGKKIWNFLGPGFFL